MSAVSTLTRLAGTAVKGAVHAATHPRETVRCVGGLVEDAVGTARTVVGGGGAAEDPTVHHAGPARPDPAAPTPEAPHDGPPPEPTPPPVFTEPKSAGGEEWHDELVDELDELEDPDQGQVAAGGPAADEPLLDPGTAKALRKESETLRKAAEVNED